ncbi:MAG: hypothetical protein J7L37_01075 [Thermococcus sp.]|nr:hypothetical protein [Thermococcus sp.]
MPTDVYREAFKLAGTIRDKYLRAVTYAKIGYYMYRAKKPLYKDAFKYALNATASIESPPLMAKALIEVASYLSKVSPSAGKKTFHEAYEVILTFPQPLRDDMLASLFERLLESGLVNDALFYAYEVEDTVKRNDLLLKALHVYLKRGNMRKAYLIVEKIQEEPWKSIGAIETIKEHLKREEFGSAIRVLSEIKSEYWLCEAMKEVAMHLKSSDVPKTTYEKFVDIALGMSVEGSFDVLRSLLIGLAVQGEIKFVMSILKRLPEEQREEILSGIAQSLADKEEQLSHFLDSLEGDEFDKVAHVTMDRLLERQPSEEFVPIVMKIGNRSSEDSVLVKVVRYLSKAGRFSEAWSFAGKVRGNHLRSLAFGSIAVEKLRVGDIDGAIDAALEVKDPKWGSWLLSEILTKILELEAGGKVREDIEEKAKAQRELWKE